MFLGWLIKLPVIGETAASLIVKCATWVAAKLGNVFIGLEQPVVNWLGAIGNYVKYVSNATLDAPVQLLSAIRWLLTSEIPHLIRALPNSVTAFVHDIGKELGGLERQVARDVAGFARLSRKIALGIVLGALAPFLLPLHWLEHVWRKIAHAAAVAGGIAEPWIWTPRLRKDVASIDKRLGQVYKLLGVTAFALVMSRVLRVTTKCLTDGNVGKTARALCKAPSQWLDGLLAGLALIVGTISLPALARDLYKTMSFAVSEIEGFWSNDLTGIETNPDLGESGGPKYLDTAASIAISNPGLGDVA